MNPLLKQEITLVRCNKMQLFLLKDCNQPIKKIDVEHMMLNIEKRYYEVKAHLCILMAFHKMLVICGKQIPL